ncbi:MAG: CHAT domain-containing protein [Phycisphaerales bacterium]
MLKRLPGASMAVLIIAMIAPPCLEAHGQAEPVVALPADGGPLVLTQHLRESPSVELVTRVRLEAGQYMVWAGAPGVTVRVVVSGESERDILALERPEGGYREVLFALPIARAGEYRVVATAELRPDQDRPTLELRVTPVNATEARFGSLEQLDGGARRAGELHGIGMTPTARLWSEALLRRVEPWMGEEHWLALELRANLGLFEHALGRSDAAIEQLAEVLERQRTSRWDMRQQSLSTANTLASALSADGRFDESIELRRRALAESSDEPNSYAKERWAHAIGLASTLHQTGRPDEAVAVLEDLIAELGHDATRSGPAHLRLAALHFTQGRLDEAERHARVALRSAGEQDYARFEALDMVARVALQRDDLAAAARALDESISIRETLRGQAEGSLLDRARRSEELMINEVGSLLALVRLRLGQHAAALEALEATRYRGYMDLMHFNPTEVSTVNRDGVEVRGTEALETVNRAIDGWREIIDSRTRRLEASDAGEWDEAYASLEQARRSLRNQEQYRSNLLADAFQGRGPEPVEEILGSLDPDEALLAFVWNRQGAGVLAFRGGRSEGVLFDDPGVIADRCRRLQRELVDPGTSVSRTLERLDSLGSLLVPSELDALLSGVSRITVVTAGPVSGLPIGAVLQTRVPGEIVVAPTASLQTELRRRDRSRTEGVVLVGRPVYPRPAGQGVSGAARAASSLDAVSLMGGALSDLPETEPECRAIDQLYQSLGRETTLLLGADATPDRLRQSIDRTRPSIVHLATHGLTGSAERPLDAAIALSTDETHAHRRQSFLTLSGLFESWWGALDGCDLVVLSACESGRGETVESGELSLAWGFFFAGSRSVVASMWKVDDRATSLLMRRLHENRLGAFDGVRSWNGSDYSSGSPMTIAAALGEAKQWLRTVDDAEASAYAASRGLELVRRESDAETGSVGYAHPYYWAGWLVIGAGD